MNIKAAGLDAEPRRLNGPQTISMTLTGFCNRLRNFWRSDATQKPKPGRSGATTSQRLASPGMRSRNMWEDAEKPSNKRMAGAAFARF
jgi:hypothetical protein